MLLLLCVGITSGGLKVKIMQHYERLLIQNYGFEHFLTIQKLYQLGLLRSQVSISMMTTISNYSPYHFH